LIENNYETLNSEELYDFLNNAKGSYNFRNQKKVVITFDDGRLSNWTIVYPLAKKYNIKIVLFVIPDRISQGDYFISWAQAREMQSSGLVDIQSHSLGHELIFINNKIIDFLNPGDPYLSLCLTKQAKDVEQNFGAPVYNYTWRSLAEREYIEDENLKNFCINYVNAHGKNNFFKKNDWKKELFLIVKKYRKSHRLKDETLIIKQSGQELVDNFKQSKVLIENALNKTCNHIALPLHKGKEIIYQAIKQAGFLSIYNGRVLKYNKNFKLDDNGIYHIRRFQGYWMRSLPGEGRISLFKKALGKITKFT
jgi:hypothetical protein